MNSKDYYEILGVSKDATEDEIKKAYRKLAREWHPDVAKERPDAEARFKEINEAYQVLGNKQKRAQYDQFGSYAFQGAHGGANYQNSDPFGFGRNGNSGPFTWSYSTGDFSSSGFDDPFDIFEQVFGFRGFGGLRKGRNLNYSLTIDFEDAIKGFEEVVKVNGKKLNVKLPPGVQDGVRVKFAGEGEDPGNGIKPGDLYITININPHKDFSRQGNDLYSTLKINLAQALLGDTIPIKVIDPKSSSGFSEKKLKIPEGSQPGSQIRLKGYGMPNKSFGRGNHYITLIIDIPKKLSKKQKEAIEQNFK